MVARAVEEITTTRGVEIEEDARDDNDLLRQTGLEKVETVSNGIRKAFQVKPAANALAKVIDRQSIVTYR